ncbi:MAG: GNAT family N-acetyltransferase [archaeon]
MENALITIRKATIKDLKSIQDLNLLLFKKEYAEYDKLLDLDWTFGKAGTEIFAKCIVEEEKCAFVAEHNKKVIGYLTGSSTPKTKYSYRKINKYGEINSMFVEEKYRNKDIGSKLVKEFFDWCKLQKVDKIKVEATALNTKAIEFYKNSGFKEYTIWLEK